MATNDLKYEVTSVTQVDYNQSNLLVVKMIFCQAMLLLLQFHEITIMFRLDYSSRKG